MRLPDRVTGLFLVGLGAAAAYGGWQLPPVPGQPVGPNVFPLVVGIGLCLCGLMIAFGIGHQFEEEAEADLVAHSDLPTDEQVLASHGPLYKLAIGAIGVVYRRPDSPTNQSGAIGRCASVCPRKSRTTNIGSA